MSLPIRILNEFYDISPLEVNKMEGYGSMNFRIKTSDKKYVLKIYQENEDLHLLEAVNHITNKLSNAFPKNIPSNTGDGIVYFSQGNKKYFAQLLTFLEGTFLAEVEKDELLLESFGSFLGKMDAILIQQSAPAIAARVQNWDLQHALMNEHLTPYITDHAQRRIVDYFFQQFKEQVVPFQYNLRKSIVHSDANDWNVLTQEGKVNALIDFGDIAYSYLINELAIAIPYAVFGKENPIEAAAHMVRGFHQELPLEEKEIQVLYYLIAARLCVSVSNSAFKKSKGVDTEYITISEKPAWALLEKWITINPFFAEIEFRKACNMPVKELEHTEILLEKRNDVLSKSLSISYQSPIHFEKAALQYMYTADGKTYLDAYNNIKHVGHCHPKVVNAIQRQAAQMNTNTRYLYKSLADYANKLLQHFPAQLNKVFFVNSGSAATDAALRMARVVTGHKDMLVMEEGYHGNTIAGIEVSHYKFSHQGGAGEASHIHTIPFPQNDLQIQSLKEAQWKTNVILALNEAKKNGLAGFIAEPILGCAGQMPLPDGFLKMTYDLVREAGGVCIADEVQIGFGRTGKFWGWEHHDVIPDMVIIGKPIANGHPMGAVVTTSEIAESFNNGMEFFSSFGGNPVSCAIGNAVLDIIEEENLIENAIEVGTYFKNRLIALQERFPIIYDVRGDGLFLGIEFRRPNETESITPTIKEELKKRYVLSSTDGPGERTLKVKPPMIFTKENVDEFVGKLEDILKRL